MRLEFRPEHADVVADYARAWRKFKPDSVVRVILDCGYCGHTFHGDYGPHDNIEQRGDSFGHTTVTHYTIRKWFRDVPVLDFVFVPAQCPLCKNKCAKERQRHPI